jgi:hypothetical protein
MLKLSRVMENPPLLTTNVHGWLTLVLRNVAEKQYRKKKIVQTKMAMYSVREVTPVLLSRTWTKLTCVKTSARPWNQQCRQLFQLHLTYLPLSLSRSEDCHLSNRAHVACLTIRLLASVSRQKPAAVPAELSASPQCSKRNHVTDIINSMELSTTREIPGCLDTRWFPSCLWNPKVQYRINKSSTHVPILSQTNPVHIIPSHLNKIHSNIIQPPTSWSS